MEYECGEVFISYSHDSPDHIERVLSLSNRLRSNGIDCVLDLYEQSPPEGWPRWMDKKIRDAQFVLLICTENYYKRVMGEVQEDVGLGIKWEGNLIYQHLYNSGTENDKFLPLIFNEDDSVYIPTPLKGATRYLISSQEDYEILYKRLLNIPQYEKPPLGEIKALLSKPVNPETFTFILNPINIPLWDKAKWNSTFYITPPDSPPYLGIGFENKDSAVKIFDQWQQWFSESDEFEELRVSIIEGDIKDEDPGYSVHIGINPDGVFTRIEREQGIPRSEMNPYFMMGSRIHRMHPPKTSKNLEKFKICYKKFQCYFLLPGVSDPINELSLEPLFDYCILKRNIEFRKVEEIHNGDIDSLVTMKDKFIY